jgi:hypothetical protein
VFRVLGINNFWISREIEGCNQKSYLLFISRCVAIWPPDQTLLTANAKILGMAIQVVGFSSREYKISKIFA